MEACGLVVGTSGNISLRLPLEIGRDLLAITPTSRYYDTLSPDDIPIIDFKADTVEGNLPPSSEKMMHIGLYQTRSDIGAVIHTHSVYASAMAVAHLDIPPILDEQTAILGGEIKVAEYAPSGSQELVKNAVEAIGDRSAVILMNHGVVGVGKDLQEAFTVCQLIEKIAETYYLCLTLGKVNRLSPAAIAAGKAFFLRQHHS